MAKYIFKQDYDAQGTNFIPDGAKIPSFMLKYSFKKGDVFEGEKKVVGVGNETGSPLIYRTIITTPEALQVDGTKWSGKAIFEVPNLIVSEQTSISSDVTSQTFLQKHQNHLLIIGALVLGYFAYKKFNK
jgi:hypothetical protein